MAISTPNAIALITKYSTEGFDKVYKHDAISSILSRDSALIRFTGAKTVKVAKFQTGGLSDYYRNNVGDPRVDGSHIDAPYSTGDSPYFGAGYRETPAALTWEERTISMDRAAKIIIEKFDDEESGGILVGNILTEFNRTQIVPEVDAYCFQQIYKNAGHVENGSVNNKPLEALNAAFTYLEKSEVPVENQIVFISPDYLNALRNTPELTKFMQQGDYEKNVSFRMTKYEGRPLIVVPPARFRTNWTFGDRGYFTDAAASDIDFIVMDKEAAVHVVKFQQTKILSGNEALIASNMDGFVMYARIYHDCFIFDNKKVGIYVHTGGVTPLSVPGSNGTPVVGIYGIEDASHNLTVEDIVTIPGDKFVSVVLVNYTNAGSVAAGATLAATTTGSGATTVAFSDAVPVKVGDVIPAVSGALSTHVWIVDVNGVFVAQATLVAK